MVGITVGAALPAMSLVPWSNDALLTPLVLWFLCIPGGVFVDALEVISVPLALVAFFLGNMTFYGAVGLLVARVGSRPPAPVVCRSCLTGNVSGVCPECGVEVNQVLRDGSSTETGRNAMPDADLKSIIEDWSNWYDMRPSMELPDGVFGGRHGEAPHALTYIAVRPHKLLIELDE